MLAPASPPSPLVPSSVLWSLLLLAFVAASPPAQAQTRSVTLQQLDAGSSIVIDGAVDALWSNATPHPIDRTVSDVPAPDDASDLSGTWRATWDDTNLYVLIDVTDDVVNNDDESGDAYGIADDSPELYVDVDGDGNAAPVSGREQCLYDDNDAQLVFEDDIVSLGYCNFGDDTPGNDVPAVTLAEVATASGYRVEASIPWTALAASAPSAGSVIGIDVHLNDDDDGSGRDHKLTWNDDDTEQAFQEPSAFGRATLSSTPLPVELIALTATLDDGAPLLRWRTASETNNAGFGVERRVDGSAWTQRAFVDGAGTTTVPQSYRFPDATVPFDARTVTYRLRQIDADGTESLSETVTVALPARRAFAFHTAYPSPVRSDVTVEFALPESQPVTMTLIDVMGRRVATLIDRPFTAGAAQETVSLPSLPAGPYVLHLSAGPHVATQSIAVLP